MKTRRLVACLPLVLLPPALAHDHPANIDPATPDAWKYKLCARMSTLAIQSMYERDRGEEPKQFAEDGTPGPRIANALVRKIHAEPSIASPKRAGTFGRAFCNEQLQSSP